MPRAKKFNLSSLDFSREENTPPWAQSLREARDKLGNAEARVDAAIGEIVQEGVAISEQQRQKAIKDFMETGDFDLAASEVQAEQPVESTPILPSKEGYWNSRFRELGEAGAELGNYVDAIQAGAERVAASAMERSSLSDNPYLRALSAAPGTTQDVLKAVTTGDISGLKVRSEQSFKEQAFGDAATLREAAEKNEAATQPYRESLKGRGWLEQQLGEGLLDVAASPASAASLVGGPFGMVAVLDAYDQSYMQAYQAGVRGEEAEIYAISQAAPELIGLIPAGKVLERIPFIKKKVLTPVKEGLEGLVSPLRNPAIDAAIKTAKTAVGEAGEEAVTGSLQDLASAVIAGTAHGDELRTLTSEQTPKSMEEFFGKRGREARAGLLMGGGLSAPASISTATKTYETAKTKEETDTLGAAEEGYRAQTRRAREQALEDVKTDTELNEDIRLEQERIAQEQAKEDAFTKAEQEQAALAEQAARQKEIEEEAAFRTIKTEAEFRGKTRVERAADTVVERVPVNPPAETTPEQVQAEREQEAANEAARVERVELGGLTEQLRKRKENLAKKGTEQQAKDDKKAKSAETRRQRVVMDQLIAENPEADPADLAPLMRSRLASATPVAPAVEQAAPATTEAVTAPVVEKATTPDKELDDEGVRKLAELAGIKTKPVDPTLNVAPTKTDANPKGEAFEPRLKRFIKGLVRANTQPTADVQNLFRQKKIIAAPNPESIGRDDTGAASYDPATGQMYIYLDRVDVDKGVVGLAKALHEATHTGQYNDREGRPSILKQMMGNEKYSTAEKLIRDNYGKNKLATAAVDKARADTKARGGDDSVEHLEVVPYFVSEATEARQGFGRLGGLVADIKTAGRGFLRDKLKVDLDISLDELNSASQKVAGEIVKTEVRQADGRGGTLNIIAGPSSTGFTKAQQQGLTYRGFVDQGERFEIADVDAELTSDNAVYDKLLKGENVTLGEFLGHPDLYKNYPQLAGYKVVLDQSLAGTSTYAAANAPDKQIEINPAIMGTINSDRKEFLREIVLHETQHIVQAIEDFIPGANPLSFLPKSSARRYENAKAQYNKTIEDFELGRAVQTLPPKVKSLWDRTVSMANVESRDAQAQVFLENGFYADATDRMINAYGNKFTRAAEELEQATAEWEAARIKAYETYLRDYGETEARNTQLRSRMTREELAAEAPESTMARAEGRVPVEATIDTTPFVGGNRPLPRAEGTLNVAPDVTRPIPEEELSEKETLRRILDHGTRMQTADIKLAEDFDTRFRRALKKDTGGEGDIDQINTAIMEALTAVDNADPSARVALWDEFSKTYPRLAVVLNEMRSTIDKNTTDYLEVLLNSGRVLSPTEIKQVETLLANRGKYLTRAFSAFQGKSGRKWAENRWADFTSKLQSYLDAPGRLSPDTRENIEAVLEAVKLVQNKIIIPDNAALSDLNTDKLEQMYEDHVGPISRLAYNRTAENELANRRAALVNELASRRDALSPEEYNTMAEQVVKELLGLDEKSSNYARLYSNLTRDPGTLKQRERLPQEILRLLGEITNPGGRVLSTLSSQAALLARAGVLSDLITKQTGTLVLPPSQINQPGMRKKFPVQLKEEQYGPLNGFFVTRRTADAITDTIGTYYSYTEALRKLRTPQILLGKLVSDIPRLAIAPITRIEKITGVVTKPYNWAGNLLGSPLALLRSGNFSPTSAKVGYDTAIDYVAGTLWNTSSSLLDDAIRYVNLEAVEVAEMQRVLGDKMKDYMAGKLTPDEVLDFLKNKVSSGQKVRRLGRAGLAGYAMLDAWTKVANFTERTQMLKAYYEALGSDKSMAEIKREAGDVTSYTNISAERVWGPLRFAEQQGITKFIPYFSETLRTTFTNYDQAFQDLARAARTDNKEAAAIMRSAANRRFLGSTLASLLLPARFPLATSMLLTAAGFVGQGFALSGEDDDDEKKRRMLNEFNRYQDLLPFGKDKDGNPIYLPISLRIDPHGPFTDMARILTMTESDQEAFDAMQAYMKDLVIAPTWIKHLYAAATQDNVSQSKLAAAAPAATEAAQDFFSNVGAGPSTINKALYAVESIVPDVLTGGNPKYKVKLDEKAPTLDRLLIKGLEKIGASFEVFTPDKALRGYGIESSEAQAADRAELADDLLLPRTTNENKVTQQLAKYRVSELKRFEESQKSVQSLRAWGYNDKEIAAMMVTAGWSKREAKNIVEGDDTSILSLSSLTQSKAAKESQEKTDAVVALIKENKDKWESMGIQVVKQ